MYQAGVPHSGHSQEAGVVAGVTSSNNGDSNNVNGTGNGSNGSTGSTAGAGSGSRPRSKVSRACDSCRKKKIKCSGTMPCKSCQTYGCDCIFSQLPTGVSKRRKRNAKNDSSSATNGINCLDNGSSHSGSVSNSHGDEKTNTPSITLLDDATISKIYKRLQEREAGEVTAASAAASASASASRSEVAAPAISPAIAPQAQAGISPNAALVPGVNAKAQNGFVSASRLASDPVVTSTNEDGLVNTGQSISNSARSPVLYISQAELESRIIKLKECILALQREGVPQSESIMYAIKNIESEIKTLEKKLARPTIDSAAISNLERNKDKSICLEAKLLKNHSGNQVNLNQYVKINTNILENYLNKPPMVDVRYGLCYSGQWLSLRGVGYFVKDYFKKDSCHAKEVEVKENLYLILRHFDINSAVENKNSECWGAPLEFYCLNFSINVSKDKRVLHLMKKIPDSLLNRLFATKPEFKSENWIHLLDHTSQHSVHLAMDAFHWIIALMETNRIDYQKVCKKHKLLAQQNGDNITKETLFFVETEELLFSLALHFFKEVSISRTNSEPVQFLEDALDFVMNIFWIDGHQIFTYLLSSVVQMLRLYGIDHWETYLVMDERMADARRSLWWKAFFWDQYSVFVTGSRPIFNAADFQAPLFPRFVRKLKFVDHQDLMRNFDKQYTMENVDFSGPDVSLRGLIGFVIFLSCFFSQQFQAKVLYGDRFSNFRTVALGPSEKLKLAEEVLSELRLYKQRLDILNASLRRYIEAEPKKVDTADDPDFEDPGIYWYVITTEASFTYCVVSTAHIVARLNLNPEDAKISQEIIAFRKNLAPSWKSTVRHLEHNNDIYDLFFMSKLIMLLAVSYVGENLAYFKHADFDDICSFVKVCRFFEYSGINCNFIENTRIQRSLLQTQFLIKILVRGVISLYYQAHGKTIDDLLTEIASSEHPEYKDTIIQLFDTSFNYFSPILNDLKESELHLQVKSMLTETLGNGDLAVPSSIFFDDIFPTYTSGGSVPSGNISATEQGNTPSDHVNEAVDAVSINTNSADQKTNLQSTNPILGHCPNNGVNQAFNASDRTEAFQNFGSASSPVAKLSENYDRTEQSTTLNLGTIYDFADHGDFDQLFSFIWDDFVDGPTTSSAKR
ncbi:unnamed protein product [Kluyveromyces dobzhanskii CBS 2104]|uniref:WGS project CCBQ000000000 data, contig 00107 n=1 Tax=Kluyveromyces dobzhanskii CBS 2104 TaxID=1427455 RepID=A0A0A8L140_9SACH|nr:unnamed protein product [Kluyveromyces dobzhanskii CBS 2104]